MSETIEEQAQEFMRPRVLSSQWGDRRARRALAASLWLPVGANADGARSALVAGNARALLVAAGLDHALEVVDRNAALMRMRKPWMPETAMVLGWNMASHRCRARWSLDALGRLFGRFDRSLLRRVSDPLPADDAFTLYRGVAGKGPMRKEAGYSWTRSLHHAAWFSARMDYADPAVVTTTARPIDVLAYLNHDHLGEFDEFIYRAPAFTRVPWPPGVLEEWRTYFTRYPNQSGEIDLQEHSGGAA